MVGLWSFVELRAVLSATELISVCGTLVCTYETPRAERGPNFAAVKQTSAIGGVDMLKKNLIIALSVAAVAGCSSQGQVNPDVMQIATTPLTCSSKAECDVWWQRAQVVFAPVKLADEV